MKLHSSMSLLHSTITTVRRHLCNHLHHQIRTFINAKVKWVRDPHLDKAVEREKNLKQLHALKTLIQSQPSKTLSISTISPLKPQLDLPTTALKFFQKYPLIFKLFQLPNKPLSPFPHVKLTSPAVSLHNDEMLVFNLSPYRKDLAERLAKLLMITRAMRLPLYVIDKFKFDLGLPNDYLLTLLPEFPEFFRVVDMGFRGVNGDQVFGLELVSWKEDLAVSVMEQRAKSEGSRGDRGRCIRFPMDLPRGFDLEKRIKVWVEEWQSLPYISPYEDAFHLMPNSDQAEKWAVAVIHEVLCLLVSKKTERENLFCLGEYLGFGARFKKAIVHHPGIFYVSNKIRTQTVVLREMYKKDMIVEKHPLMSMRWKYVRLMNTVMRRGKPIRNRVYRRSQRSDSSVKVDRKRAVGRIRNRGDNGDLDSLSCQNSQRQKVEASEAEMEN